MGCPGTIGWPGRVGPGVNRGCPGARPGGAPGADGATPVPGDAGAVDEPDPPEPDDSWAATGKARSPKRARCAERAAETTRPRARACPALARGLN